MGHFFDDPSFIQTLHFNLSQADISPNSKQILFPAEAIFVLLYLITNNK